MKDGVFNPDADLSYEAITEQLPILEACLKVRGATCLKCALLGFMPQCCQQHTCTACRVWLAKVRPGAPKPSGWDTYHTFLVTLPLTAQPRRGMLFEPPCQAGHYVLPPCTNLHWLPSRHTLCPC